MKLTCFNCNIAGSTPCDIDPKYTDYTLEQCQNIVDGTAFYMTEYQDDQDCRKFSCILDELEFKELRWITRPTCISGKSLKREKVHIKQFIKNRLQFNVSVI